MVPVYRMERSIKRSWKRAWIQQLTFILAALTSVHGCAGTVINLYKGACSTDLQHEQVAVKTFLKGTRKEKELLKSEDSELCSLWCLPCLFYLRCCYQSDCIHPICRPEKPQERFQYSDGPPLSLMPLLTPDPARPYGSTACQECKGFCMSHYFNPNQLEELAKNSDVVPSNKPPSQVIADAFKQHKGIPPRLKCLNWQSKFFSILMRCKCGWSTYKVCQQTGRKEQGRSKEGSPKEEKGLLKRNCFE